MNTVNPNKTDDTNNPTKVGNTTGITVATATQASVTAIGRPERNRPIKPRQTKDDRIVPTPTIAQTELTITGPAPSARIQALRNVRYTMYPTAKQKYPAISPIIERKRGDGPSSAARTGVCNCNAAQIDKAASTRSALPSPANPRAKRYVQTARTSQAGSAHKSPCQAAAAERQCNRHGIAPLIRPKQVDASAPVAMNTGAPVAPAANRQNDNHQKSRVNPLATSAAEVSTTPNTNSRSCEKS